MPSSRQHSRVSSQTRPHCRTLVLLRPRQNASKAGPEGLVAQIDGDRLAAGDDQPVRTLLWRLLTKVINAKVIAVHATLTKRSSFHLGQGIKREVDQYISGSRLKQPEKLKLDCAHGCIAHIVDQADVQKNLRLSSVPGCTRGQLRPDHRLGSRYFAFNKTGMDNSLLCRVLDYIATFRA